jgi:hypothetical protein
VGERGPKPQIIVNLTPEDRAELDEAIIDGRATKTELYERYKDRCGVAYQTFCNYAQQLEARAKNRYVGELLTKVFGNMPDSDIDTRARGVVMGILNRLAVDVMHDGELNPKDLCNVVKSFDMLRRGSIAEADAARRQTEWEVVRAAGVAEAASQIKQALASELAGDPGLRQRLESAVDRTQERMDRPTKDLVTAQIIDRVSRKRGVSREVRAALYELYGLDIDKVEPKPEPSAGEVRQRVREAYNLPNEGGA